jgi:uncharacterized protein
MRRSVRPRITIWLALLGLATCSLPVGCGSGDGQRRQQFLDLGTAPPGGAFFPVGTAIAEVLNEHRGEGRWRIQAKGSRGSLENIRRLEAGEYQLGMSNAAISYFAIQGERAWDKSYQVRTVVTLAPNVAMFVTKADSGIKSIADLRDRRVILGPEGAGFEMFVTPILEEHGLSLSDIRPLNAEQSRAVDLLADGAADAAFLGGAVPTPAIQQACNNMDILLIPFDPQARQQLIDKYPFFQPAVIPATTQRDGQSVATYRGMTEDYQGLDVGRMHLITHASVDEELVYELTRTLWEHREEVAQRHPVGRTINEGNAAKLTGVPFHPGAERFYREAGIWQEAP